MGKGIGGRGTGERSGGGIALGFGGCAVAAARMRCGADWKRRRLWGEGWGEGERDGLPDALQMPSSSSSASSAPSPSISYSVRRRAPACTRSGSPLWPPRLSLPGEECFQSEHPNTPAVASARHAAWTADNLARRPLLGKRTPQALAADAEERRLLGHHLWPRKPLLATSPLLMSERSGACRLRDRSGNPGHAAREDRRRGGAPAAGGIFAASRLQGRPAGACVAPVDEIGGRRARRGRWRRTAARTPLRADEAHPAQRHVTQEGGELVLPMADDSRLCE